MKSILNNYRLRLALLLFIRDTYRYSNISTTSLTILDRCSINARKYWADLIYMKIYDSNSF